ncbi:MAG: tetraacyldisaccharide 4'-kinase [Acidobacteria bacterium]|nr:tetraacyldisaccharide 4'-kinase [Acidobacteriota bacterium]
MREVAAAARGTAGVSDPPPGRWIPALAPLSRFYGAVVAARNRRHDRNPERAGRAEVPVVSLGNLTVGGTGKTPLTVFLARRLREEGWRPAVVSRGYRRGSRSLEETVGSPGGGPGADAVRRLGDEPAWMAARLPGIPVIVCSDRLRAVRHARARYGASLALLDDGFQHRRLHRDVDLLLVDSLNPFGNGRLLPAGPLREPPEAIRRASAVLLTRWDLCAHPENLEAELRRWMSPGVPLFRFRQRCAGLVPAADPKRGGVEALAGIPALAFAGIGHPAAFAAELRRSGLPLVAAVWFRDHHPYTLADRERILQVAVRRGAEVLLTTEKDRVRFPVEGCPLPVFALEVVQEPMEEGQLLAFLRAHLPSPPAAERPVRGATP